MFLDAANSTYLKTILNPKRLPLADDQEIHQEMFYQRHPFLQEIDSYGDIFQPVQLREICNSHDYMVYDSSLKRTRTTWRNDGRIHVPTLLHFTSGALDVRYEEYFIGLQEEMQAFDFEKKTITFINADASIKQVPLLSLCAAD